jgi:hypothetical protein
MSSITSGICLKDLAPTDPRANYVVDIVRGGQIKLTHLIGTDNIDQLVFVGALLVGAAVGGALFLPAE